MRIFLLQISFFILFLVLTLFHGRELYGGETMPFHLKVVEPAGKETTLESLRGRKVVLAVYTSSMPDCRRHIERFVRLSESFMHEDALFSVVDITPLGYEEFLNTLPDNMGNVFFRKDLEGNLGRILDVIIIPTTFFISAEGQVFGRYQSIHLWDSKEFKERVKKFIEPGG
ncbi:MAG: redoxin domain-containing protein [Deltaproteobacteria bacterium]|nr:redoxin domain-containing protein [Deltaproteobacteria bacterium]